MEPKKAYKSMIRHKKRQSTDFVHSRLSGLQTSSPRELWKVIHKARKPAFRDLVPVDVDHLGSYFGKLLKGPENLHHNINAIPGYEMDADLDS